MLRGHQEGLLKKNVGVVTMINFGNLNSFQRCNCPTRGEPTRPESCCFPVKIHLTTTVNTGGRSVISPQSEMDTFWFLLHSRERVTATPLRWRKGKTPEFSLMFLQCSLMKGLQVNDVGENKLLSLLGYWLSEFPLFTTYEYLFIELRPNSPT